jgi:hypothetical protein
MDPPAPDLVGRPGPNTGAIVAVCPPSGGFFSSALALGFVGADPSEHPGAITARLSGTDVASFRLPAKAPYDSGSRSDDVV